MHNILFLLFSIICFSCRSGPDKIYIDLDMCSHCEMKISDTRFAAQIITSKGKVFKFDDYACLIEFQNESKNTGDTELYVALYTQGGEWINVVDAYFAYGEEIRSPMRGNAAAFRTESEAGELARKISGEVLRWQELVKKAGL